VWITYGISSSSRVLELLYPSIRPQLLTFPFLPNFLRSRFHFLMPQLDLVLFSTLLSALLALTILLLLGAAEAILLTFLGLRGRRLLASGGSASPRSTPLTYGGALRPLWLTATSSPVWRALVTHYLHPYDAACGTAAASPTATTGFGPLLRRAFSVVGTSDHKLIGRLYLLFGFGSALVGSILSLAIRLQLTYPGSALVGENYQLYNVVVTMHAVIMIFMFVMPVLIGGFGNFIVPLQLGVPDVAFPRVNALSFWLLPVSLSLMYQSMLEKLGPGGG